jgi:hypothetical protein
MARTPDEIIDQAAKVLRDVMGGYHATEQRQREAARALADAGLLADPDLAADRRRIIAEKLELHVERNVLSWLHAEAVYFGHGWCQQWLSARDAVREQQSMLGSLLALTIQQRDSLARQCARYFAHEQEQQGRIDKALALHQLAVSDDLVSYCNTCLTGFPCPTVEALSGDAASEPAPTLERGADAPSAVGKNGGDE